MISMARWEWWVRWHLIIEGDPLLCSPHPQDPLLSSPYPLAPHIFAYRREISWPQLRPLPHHICPDFKNFLTNDKLMPLLPMSGQWQTGKNFSATGRDSRPLIRLPPASKTFLHHSAQVCLRRPPVQTDFQIHFSAKRKVPI